jgi:MT0933-like antitoxin protein
MTDDEKTLADRAKDAAEKAKEAAVKAKDKARDFVGEHEDQIDNAIDKTGGFVDEKITKGRFTEKVDKAQDAAKGAVSKIAGKPDSDGDDTETAG